jgi:signal transduction histidine kinase/ActR/RegA family two-component response regulator
VPAVVGTSWQFGIIGRALLILGIGTTLVVLAGAWIGYDVAASRFRSAKVGELQDFVLARTAREALPLETAERNLIHARRLLAARANATASAAILPGFHVDADGSRRLERPPAGTPLAAHAHSEATGDTEAMRSFNATVSFLRELGPVWCENLPAMAVASPDGWMVTWGEMLAELPASLLPKDPVLLPSERELLSRPGEGVRWSGDYLEPATNQRFATALIPVELNGRRCAITHPVPIDDLLLRLTRSPYQGAVSIVLDRTHKALVWKSTPGDALLEELAVATAAGGATSTLQLDPTRRWWVAASPVPTIGWEVVSFFPVALVNAPAQAAAGVALILGLAILAAQAVLLVWVLRRRVAHPLKQLAVDVGRVAAGERNLALATTREDEIGDLARSVRAMAAAVAVGEHELRAALAALREREQLYHGLFSGGADAVLLLRDGKVTDANDRACALFAREHPALLGVALCDLLAAAQPQDATPAGLVDALTRQADAGEHDIVPLRGRRGDHDFDAEVTMTRVTLGADVVHLLSLRDTSERNQLEAQLRHRQRLDSLGQLAGGVAHDFNNMLTAIMGSAELLTMRLGFGHPLSATSERIISTCKRAADLVRKLLTFSRRSVQAKTPIDLHGLIRDTVPLLERSFDRRITVRCELLAAHAVVLGDASELQNALLNLAFNARDAMPDGGAFTIRSSSTTLDAKECAALGPGFKPGTYLDMRLRDTGCGMKPEVAVRIFEPFFTTKPVGKGTGLGLSAVYGTVNDHRGSISVDSAPGAGTEFRLLLPLADPAVPAHATSLRILPAPFVTREPGAQPVILLVDDEEAVRTTAASLLEDLGYQVLQASDGREGVSLYARTWKHLDAVVLDMEMPGLRGIECLREMRLINPGVRAILCSGYIRDSSPGEIEKAGFQACMEKPFQMNTLARTLAAVLGTAPRSPEP